MVILFVYEALMTAIINKNIGHEQLLQTFLQQGAKEKCSAIQGIHHPK